MGTYTLRVPASRVGYVPDAQAACPRAPRTVRTGYAYQPRALGTYRVPWHPRYLGSLLDSLADIAAGRSKPPGPASWALLAVGLAATVAVLVYVSRAATARVAAARLRKPPADADGVP